MSREPGRPPEPPEELRELDRALRGVRFDPRASLGAEVRIRLRREAAAGAPGRRASLAGRPARRRLAAGAALAAAATLVVALATRGLPDRLGVAPVAVDRCCFDLDGGGRADDGVLVHATGGERVARLAVYEDADGTGDYSAGDFVRFARGARPTLDDPPAGLVTIRHCCLDFDGGGPDDDGLLVVGLPPDRVVMAAIYERAGGGRPGGAHRAMPLR